MCSPTIALATLAVVSTVASAEQQKSMAAKQEQAIQDGLARDREATAEQYKQIQQTSMDDQAKLHTDYLIDAARIRAMQGESGLQGASHERVAQEADNTYATDAATLEINRQRQMTNAKTQGVAQQSRANVQLAGIKYPSAAGTALQIAGNVASLYKPGGDVPNKGAYTGAGADGYGSWNPTAAQKGFDW